MSINLSEHMSLLDFALWDIFDLYIVVNKDMFADNLRYNVDIQITLTAKIMHIQS